VTTPWYEPFGITPVEAMACGRPVVGAAVGGIMATVVDGETGFLVPPKDPAAVADRLARLFADPALLRACGRKARRRAVARYTWARVCETVEAVYEEVLTGRRPGVGRRAMAPVRAAARAKVRGRDARG